MRIDSHQHFWKFDPVKYAWIDEEMKAIRKDFLPEDLAPLLAKNRIDGCITVQVDQTEFETLSLLSLAGKNDFIKGVVGWVDLKAPDILERLGSLCKHKKLKGFRHIVQGLPDGFLLQKDFLNGISALTEFGFTYDILVYPHQLADTILFVERFPNQKFVLDHLAKPFIRKGILSPWKEKIKHLGSFENVHCKLSGMVTEAGWKNWKREDFEPYLDSVLNAFSSRRVFYGSDWPVCLVAADYEQQLSIVEDYISKLSISEKSGIMGENAIQFYNI